MNRARPVRARARPEYRDASNRRGRRGDDTRWGPLTRVTMHRSIAVTRMEQHSVALRERAVTKRRIRSLLRR
jgi:hypothetical protein